MSNRTGTSVRERAGTLCREAVARAARPIAGTIAHVVTQQPVVALTFDDGPHPEYTPPLLNILDKHQARATFFMVGEAAREHMAVVRRAAEAGHAIGNHSWNHPSFRMIDRAERLSQIQQCASALAPYGGRIFRPPYGAEDAALSLMAFRLGYRVIGWNLDVGDCWFHDPRETAELLLDQVRPGAIVLLHDALFDNGTPPFRRSLPREPSVNREATIEAVRLFLERVDRRYRFVTVPELLRCGNPSRRPLLS
jgi:peptidoglycan/xylan/chitin deacetylase (PgdA/CDA1 family)